MVTDAINRTSLSASVCGSSFAALAVGRRVEMPLYRLPHRLLGRRPQVLVLDGELVGRLSLRGGAPLLSDLRIVKVGGPRNPKLLPRRAPLAAGGSVNRPLIGAFRVVSLLSVASDCFVGVGADEFACPARRSFPSIYGRE